MNSTHQRNDSTRLGASGVVFPELAETLFYFIEKLYLALVQKGAERVFFLSREGQPLMRLFDMYRDREGGGISSHYLEVSRRATLLPSLETLSDESFDTLFRQYRRISLFEFLASLGLEPYCERICEDLGLGDRECFTRHEDFPTSSSFAALKELPVFQELYESERIERRAAFIRYLSDLSGGLLPSELVIVDVGWKGTIQDNLFALLCRRGDTSVRSVTGYYVGLIAKGAAGLRNDKFGLLFSATDTPSEKYRVFNENRALFEVMLAADHGSIVRYETESDGRSHAVEGEFDEREMLEMKVFPVQREIFRRFSVLVASRSTLYLSGSRSFQNIVRGHARMVFNPTLREREWFSSVFHVENYGVFERSTFDQREVNRGMLDRLRFVKRVLQSRDIGRLGFWPWKTLYEQGGPLPAAIYAGIRRLQR